MSATLPEKRSISLRAAQILLYINAAIWLILGIATLLRLSRSNLESPITLWIIALLMASNAGMMLLTGWGLGTGSRLLYFLALTVMAVNIILTFTDEFGLLDFITLVTDLIILALLIFGRPKKALATVHASEI